MTAAMASIDSVVSSSAEAGRAASRALAVVAMVAWVAGVYGLVAIGGGALVAKSGLLMPVVATAIVALTFERTRRFVDRWARRLILGAQATPTEALSELVDTLVEALPVGQLPRQLARSLQSGTGATCAQVWLRDEHGFRTIASSPDRAPRHVADVAALPPGAELVSHDGQVLGALTIERSTAQVPSAADLALLSDLNGPAALIMHRLRLDRDLEHTALLLERSRRRLVEAQGIELRRIDGDLRAQVMEVLQRLDRELHEAHHVASGEQTTRAADLLADVRQDAASALEHLRALVRGLRPPVLEAEGLRAALSELVARSPLETRVDLHLPCRRSTDVEGAVYFCIAEALVNASKHGRAPVQVRVEDTGTSMCFTVSDAGPGFDPTAERAGSGLRNMVDRAESLGGHLTISSAPGRDTRVSGELPLPLEESVQTTSHARAR